MQQGMLQQNSDVEQGCQHTDISFNHTTFEFYCERCGHVIDDDGDYMWYDRNDNGEV